MQKPSYYLWRNAFSTQEEFEHSKEHYTNLGFRVVTFTQGQNARHIQEGIKAIIQNHISDTEPIPEKDVIP